MSAATELHQQDDRNDPLFDDSFMETLEYLQIIARKILSGQMKAERRSKQKGMSVEFLDHRPYSPGDDFRFIDWNVYVRTQSLFLKLFEEEEDLYIYLLVDCSASMDFGIPYKFHYARRLAASIGYLGLAGMDRVFVVPFSSSLPKSANEMLRVRGKGKVFRMLNFLERMNAQGTTDINTCFRSFAASKRKRGLAVVISDLYDADGVFPALNALRFQKFELFVVHLVSPQERDPQLLGDIRLIDCETEAMREVTITERLLSRYQATFLNYCASVESFCRTREIGYVRADTTIPFQDTVIRMLRREKFLQ